MFAVEARGLKQLVVVLLGEGDGDAVVVVLHQLLPQEDERLGCSKDADIVTAAICDRACFKDIMDFKNLIDFVSPIAWALLHVFLGL